MSKFIIFVNLILASSVLSAPNSLRSLPALKHEHISDEFGQYALRYVTAEGTIITEQGKLVKTADGKGHVMEIEGEVTYVGDDGKTYNTKYTAGVDGVKMEGEHLPVAPTVAPVDAAVAPVLPTTSAPVSEAAVAVDAKSVIPEAPAVPPMAVAA